MGKIVLFCLGLDSAYSVNWAVGTAVIWITTFPAIMYRLADLFSAYGQKCHGVRDHYRSSKKCHHQLDSSENLNKSQEERAYMQNRLTNSQRYLVVGLVGLVG